MNDASPVQAAVIGFPVKHSRSPLIHNYWLQQFGIAARYDAVAVAPPALEEYLRALHKRGMKGVNVTVPHKEDTCRLMDKLDDAAKMAGAVNTVVVQGNGALHGFNTDIYGFTANLQDKARDWKKKKPALVMGAGGAARAVIVALTEAKCSEIRICNRTSDRGRELIKDMRARLDAPLKLVAWEDRDDAMEDIGLFVNTTTQGMAGQPPLDVDLRNLPEHIVVTDLVYTPLLTPLLLEAKRRGHTIVDGLGMLLHQAQPGFAAWFGRETKVTPELRQMVEDSL